MKRSIREPIPEIFDAWALLNDAVDAHLSGDVRRAEASFLKADMRAVWEWLNPGWSRANLNVVLRNPPDDTCEVPKNLRDPDRNISLDVRAAALQRDGYRCRYCGIPVVPADIRKLAHRWYPDAVPWEPYDPAKQHAAFACCWLQFDHVVPHSHGGRSSLDNVVVACALCNFGKDKYTLRQLNVFDPRLSPPVVCDWDGLQRFRAAGSVKAQQDPANGRPRKRRFSEVRAFFFPGARLSRGYLYTGPIAGKERWFKLDERNTCAPTTRGGIAGYLLSCDPAALRRRGIDPELFADRGV